MGKKRNYNKVRRSDKARKRLRVLGLIGGGFVLLCIAAAYYFFSSAVESTVGLYIPTHATYAQVCDSLEKSRSVNMFKFECFSRLYKYPRYVKPGFYTLDLGKSAREIVLKLRSGNQDVKRLSFTKFRTVEDLSRGLSRQIEADSASIASLLKDEEFLKDYSIGGEPLTSQTVICCFIPNTYHVFWNLSARELFERMYTEHQRFWNPHREARLQELKLSRIQAITLASIVEQETNYDPEKKNIASVYLNRLRKGMLLQADPTVVFALQDFGKRRILKADLTVDSPYNTYRYKGLPPGPICTPSISSIDAVLANEKTPYFYFCANADLRGSHVFATSYVQHLRNASEYHKKLRQMNIR